MRVLVSTTAGLGHFGPLLPYARACVAAGHEVLVAAPASFAPEVAAAGFEHRPFPDAPPELLGAVFGRVPSLTFEEADAVVVADVFGRLDAQAALPGLADVIDDEQPDLVLREEAEFGSLVAARAAGVAQAVVAIGLTAMTEHIAHMVAGPLAELDALAGLAEGTATSTLHSAPVLSCVPALLDGPRPAGDPVAGRVHRFRDAPPDSRRGALPPAWGDPAHPLVLVSFGTVAGGVGGLADLYPAVLAALADSPVRVLLTTGHGVEAGDLGTVPANAHVEQWWPQADVMPHAAAVAGHGGFGTTMTALGAGVPQVVVPLFAMDQHINGEHVAAVGAGVHLPGGPADLGLLPGALARVLSDTAYRDAARAVRDEMAALPPLTEAVDLLERLAGG